MKYQLTLLDIKFNMSKKIFLEVTELLVINIIISYEIKLKTRMNSYMILS